VQHSGKPIKWLGDGVMFFFDDPGLGVRAALEMVDGWPTQDCHRPTSASTPGLFSSRRAIPSARP
jgi:hypothetical protein